MQLANLSISPSLVTTATFGWVPFASPFQLVTRFVYVYVPVLYFDWAFVLSIYNTAGVDQRVGFVFFICPRSFSRTALILLKLLKKSIKTLLSKVV